MNGWAVMSSAGNRTGPLAGHCQGKGMQRCPAHSLLGPPISRMLSPYCFTHCAVLNGSILDRDVRNVPETSKQVK